MRTKIIVVGSSMLLAFGVALAQDAPKPGPEQKALGYFAGKWTSEAEMKPGPFGPGGKMTSVDTCEWFAGGFQLVCRGQGSGAMGSMTTLGVIAYSPTEKSYTYYGIDSTGMADYSKGQKSGKTWSFGSKSEMNGKPFHSRYTMVESSPTSYTYKWDMSEDGTKWTTVMEGKSTKKTE
ncbi:MAG TPA: DUF1579 family protein [Steroidobacteraceae bacterium]|nr:DUF1579 family protein [Steroidobacteraceae bacterium]